MPAPGGAKEGEQVVCASRSEFRAKQREQPAADRGAMKREPCLDRDRDAEPLQHLLVQGAVAIRLAQDDRYPVRVDPGGDQTSDLGPDLFGLPRSPAASIRTRPGSSAPARPPSTRKPRSRWNRNPL